MKNIVLIIDWQNCYFDNDNQNTKYMGGAIQKTVAVIKQARKNNDKIVWVPYFDPNGYYDDYNYFNEGYKNPESYFVNNPSVSYAFHPALSILRKKEDTVIYKNTQNAFESSYFKSYIEATPFKHLIFTGYSINDCIRSTLTSAIKLGYGSKCILLRDACGPAPQKYIKHRDNLYYYLSNIAKGHVCSTARFIESRHSGNKLKSIFSEHLDKPYSSQKVKYPCNEFKSVHWEIETLLEGIQQAHKNNIEPQRVHEYLEIFLTYGITIDLLLLFNKVNPTEKSSEIKKALLHFKPT